MKQLFLLTVSLLLTIMASNSWGQEQAPRKTFEFTISINQLKTQEQANQIKSEVTEIEGVQSCELVLIEYELVFTCTNHDMNRYLIMDKVKAVIVSNGSEIIKINRREI